MEWNIAGALYWCKWWKKIVRMNLEIQLFRERIVSKNLLIIWIYLRFNNSCIRVIQLLVFK